ncbi:hypothetical protein EMIT0P2_10539 [Pseudomonas sp. IT-P2]
MSIARHQCGLAFNLRDKGRVGRGGLGTSQFAACLATRQIDHDDAARAADRRVGNVGGPFLACTEVKAHVIDIGGRQDDVVREHNRFCDLVGGQVDRHQLGSARMRRGKLRCGRVEHPDAAFAVGNHTLHADESLGRVLRIRDIGFQIRVGHKLTVGNFRNGVGHVITPPGEVHEDPAGFGYRHACRHGPVERVNTFDDGAFARITLRYGQAAYGYRKGQACDFK